MTNEEEFFILIGLQAAVNDNSITEAEAEAARRALERALETEAMYEGLCK